MKTNNQAPYIMNIMAPSSNLHAFFQIEKCKTIYIPVEFLALTETGTGQRIVGFFNDPSDGFVACDGVESFCGYVTPEQMPKGPIKEVVTDKMLKKMRRK